MSIQVRVEAPSHAVLCRAGLVSDREDRIVGSWTMSFEQVGEGGGKAMGWSKKDSSAQLHAL